MSSLIMILAAAVFEISCG